MSQRKATAEEKYGIRYRIGGFGYRMLQRCLAAVTPMQKQIMMNAFNGKHFCDNPRAIAEEMHRTHPEYRILWAAGKGVRTGELPDYVTTVQKKSLRFYREFVRSCCYVTNERIGRSVWKRKGQKFVQTWHGDRGIKKILYDSLPPKENAPWIMDEFLTDIFTVGSDYAEKRIQTAFRYHGKTLKSGCPRNDCLVRPRGEDAVREKIGVPAGKRILLYAPTLRQGQRTVKGTLDIDATLAHLRKGGEDWVCLVRAHPKTMRIEVGGESGRIDVSGYPDMADLLMIADCLITDYSSCAGDFALRKKALFLVQYDREEYIEAGRSFYIDPKEAGYLIAESQEELNGMIDRMDEKDYAENCEHILNYYGTRETGHATKDICEWICRETK